MQGIAFGPSFSRYAITFTSFYSLPVQENDMPSGWEAFKIAPWKKSVSRRPFWHSGVRRYGRNNTVGQSRWRRDIHMLLGIYTGCMGLAAQFLKHTWHSHNLGYTAPVSTAPFPKLSTWRSPTQPHQSLADASPFILAFLDLSVQSDLALSPNVLVCEFHQIKNCVLPIHGSLAESCRSMSTESAFNTMDWMSIALLTLLNRSLYVYVLFLLPRSEQHTSSFA